MHGPGIFFEPKWWRIDEKIAQSKFVACISHFCRSQAMLFSDQVHWQKLHIVHCGVSPEKYGARPREAFGKHVLFVGRLDPVKGVTILLEAFAEARRSHPDAKLTVVGDGPARAALETQTKMLGVSEATTFLGYCSQSDVANLLQRADCLVLPSFAEGVPVVLMEAMASGKPVIATQVGGVAELVQDGASGFLVPPGDVKALTSKLLTLFSDQDLCHRMGEIGRQKVMIEFNVRREAAWLLSLLQGRGTGLRMAAEQSDGDQAAVVLAAN
jgi:glycosyltransferase involved in cell wall biosynthesis